MPKTKSIAVIGAGIAGLTCAYELKRAGFDVTVFEREKHVGGRMATRNKKGFPFDIGANHLCDLYDHIKAYCETFGLEFKPMEFVKYGIFKNGRVIDTEKALGPLSRARLALQMLRTGKRNEWQTFFNLSGEIENDDESAYDFIKRRCGQTVADYIADPFSTTYQFHRSTEISKGALLSIMESIKTEKPRWYLHHTDGEMSGLPEALAKDLNVKKGVVIESVKSVGKRAQVRHGKITSTFDAAVLASPATATRAIYQNPSPSQKRLLNKVQYATTIGVAFRVPAERMPDTSIVWVPYVESQTISGYTNEVMKGGEMVQSGESLICVWLHEDFAKSIMGKSDREIFAIVKRELLKVCPWFSSERELVNEDLQRWTEAMPKFYPGYLTAVHDFLRKGQGDNRIFFCGDYLNSPWTEGSVRCGQRVADTVTSALA